MTTATCDWRTYVDEYERCNRRHIKRGISQRYTLIPGFLLAINPLFRLLESSSYEYLRGTDCLLHLQTMYMVWRFSTVIRLEWKLPHSNDNKRENISILS